MHHIERAIELLDRHRGAFELLLREKRALRQEIPAFWESTKTLWGRLPESLPVAERVVLLRELLSKYLDEQAQNESFVDDQLLGALRDSDLAERESRCQASATALTEEHDARIRQMEEAHRDTVAKLQKKLRGKENEASQEAKAKQDALDRYANLGASVAEFLRQKTDHTRQIQARLRSIKEHADNPESAFGVFGNDAKKKSLVRVPSFIEHEIEQLETLAGSLASWKSE